MKEKHQLGILMAIIGGGGVAGGQWLTFPGNWGAVIPWGIVGLVVGYVVGLGMYAACLHDKEVGEMLDWYKKEKSLTS